MGNCEQFRKTDDSRTYRKKAHGFRATNLCCTAGTTLVVILLQDAAFFCSVSARCRTEGNRFLTCSGDRMLTALLGVIHHAPFD